jgi:GTPase involved in cell partitioning and DNA repair
MSQNEDDQVRCYQILNTLLNILRKSQNTDEDKEDVLMVNKVDMQRKYEIEKSKVYIGYKLFYIIKIFLEGKSFPSGYLG